MKQAGRVLGETVQELVHTVSAGMTELEVDKLAENLIRARGGEPGFRKVPGYQHTICISVNNVVVHGIPKKRILKAGDVVGIDCGVYLNGYHTDMAETILIKKSKLKTQHEAVEKFLKTGKQALFAGIRQVKAGNRVGHISSAIQKIVEGGGYSVVRNLVGHGVGKELHEEPEIPGYLERTIEKTPLLKEGMTIAVEVIYNMKGNKVIYEGTDNWTIVTEDNSISGLFERTVLVGEEGVELITSLQDDTNWL